MLHFIIYFKNCNTFDDLVYILYTRRTKRYDFYHLLLICHMNIFSDHIVLICSNLISAPDTNLNPVEFGWNSVDSVLMPNKCIVKLPQMYTVTCGCKQKMHWKMSGQQFWCFMHSILQVQRRRMVYLSLPTKSVGHCIRYANINVFFEPNFSVYGQKITMLKKFLVKHLLQLR